MTPATSAIIRSSILAAGVSLHHRRQARCEAAVEEDVPALVKQAEEERKTRKKPKNPGPFERISEDAKRVTGAETFDGFRLNLSKSITPTFAIAHSLAIGAQEPGAEHILMYDFTVQAVSPPQQIMAKSNNRGQIEGIWQFPVASNILAKVATQLQPNPAKDSVTAELEANGDSYNASLKTLKFSDLSLSYMQSLTSWLAVGIDSAYSPSQMASMINLGAKFTGPDYLWSVQLLNPGQTAMLVQYVKNVNPGRMSLVADMSMVGGEAETLLGMELTLKQSKIISTISHKGTLATLIEARVLIPIILMLSAEVDYPSSRYKFGYGFSLSL